MKRSTSSLVFVAIAFLDAAVWLALCPSEGAAQTRSAARADDVAVDAEISRRVAVRMSNLERNKVVGGVETQVDEFPWAVALTFKNSEGRKQYCGGSLISREWALTAAHCDVLLTDEVVIGRHDLRTEEGEVIGVSMWIPHQGYNKSRDDSENDIALVKLARAPAEAPVPLDPHGSTLARPPTEATVIGWGRLKEGGATSPTLQKVTIPLITNAVCKQRYAGTFQIADSMVCAEYVGGGKDSCQGDSGGPLLAKAQGLWRQIGVVSFGEGCARDKKPGVYTRVADFADWIKTTIQSN